MKALIYIFVGFWMLLVSIYLGKIWEEVKIKPEPKVVQVKPTAYDITLECQKISATVTNKGWNYANCVNNLQKTLGGKNEIKIL